MLKIIKVGHISVFVDDGKFFVHFRLTQNNKILEEDSRIFDILDPNNAEIPKIMKIFFDEFYNKVRYAYVSTINFSFNQGVFVYGQSPQDSVKLDVASSTIYATNQDLAQIQQSFQDIYGVDFIFSLEGIVQFIRPQENGVQLCLLVLKDSAFVAIFNQNALVFSSRMQVNLTDSIVIDEKNDELSDDTEENDFGDLGDLADLGDLDNLDDFLEDTQTEEKEANLEEDLSSLQTEDDIKRDNLILEFMQLSLKDYYKNPNLNSDFLENICVFMACEFNTNLVQNIKEALFLETKEQKIKLGQIVCDLSIKEALYYEKNGIPKQAKLSVKTAKTAPKTVVKTAEKPAEKLAEKNAEKPEETKQNKQENLDE